MGRPARCRRRQRPTSHRRRPARTPGPCRRRSIELVLGPHDADESEVWKTTARSQAGLEKVKLKILGPAEPPSTQADLVREALDRHPRVLVVESTGTGRSPSGSGDRRGPGPGDTGRAVGPAAGRRQVCRGGQAMTQDAIDSLRRSASSGRRGGAAAFERIGQAVGRGGDPDRARLPISNPAKRRSSWSTPWPTPSSRIACSRSKTRSRPRGSPPSKRCGLSATTTTAEKAVEASLKANPKTILVFAVDSVSSASDPRVVKNDVDHRFFVAAATPARSTLPS